MEVLTVVATIMLLYVGLSLVEAGFIHHSFLAVMLGGGVAGLGMWMLLGLAGFK